MAAAVNGSQQLIERVQELTEQLEEVQDFQARAVADELVSSVMALYGEGLARIVAALGDDRATVAQIRERLVDDGVVASLLLIHDLYPVPLEARVAEALESVRPYMESHGGDVELVGIVDGVAKLRLVGHCKGCPASEATLELAIKKAIEDAAPDLAGLEVEGVRELPVVQSGASTWTDLESATPVSGATIPITVGGTELLVANVGGTLLAYRNTCASCAARLDTAAMSPSGTLTCSSCERRYELRHAGRSPDDEALQIDPVPLLRGDGRVRVAVA